MTTLPVLFSLPLQGEVLENAFLDIMGIGGSGVNVTPP